MNGKTLICASASVKLSTEFCGQNAVSVLSAGMGCFSLWLSVSPQVDMAEGALTDWISISTGLSTLTLGWDFICTPLKWTYTKQPGYFKIAI